MHLKAISNKHTLLLQKGVGIDPTVYFCLSRLCRTQSEVQKSSLRVADNVADHLSRRDVWFHVLQSSPGHKGTVQTVHYLKYTPHKQFGCVS